MLEAVAGIVKDELAPPDGVRLGLGTEADGLVPPAAVWVQQEDLAAVVARVGRPAEVQLDAGGELDLRRVRDVAGRQMAR